MSKKRRKTKTKKKLHSLKEWLKAVTYALLIVILAKALIGDFFVVPTGSMENTIMKGDFVYVNKLSYGPRIPITPLSFPFSTQRLPFSAETASYLDWIQLPYLRLPGLDAVQRGDVMVFNYPAEWLHPIDQRLYYVKRCVALPGDTLNIINKRVFVNGDEVDSPEYSLMKYRLLPKTGNALDFLESLEIESDHYGQLNRTIYGYFTEKEIDTLYSSGQFKALKPVVQRIYKKNHELFPFANNIAWNLDFYGPIWAPKKGDSIELKPFQLSIYQQVIEQHEKKTVTVVDQRVFIDNREATHYTFEQDYFFVLGDNRDNSGDSRYWGFVPENHLIGKAEFVLYSADRMAPGPFNLRWSRFFKAIE